LLITDIEQVSWIDSHCHLSDERISDNLDNQIQRALDKGITTFISSALSKKDVNWHIESELKNMYWTAGIHPFYKEQNKITMDDLENLCSEKRIIAVGEIGLDRRSSDKTEQEKILLDQLDLARQYDLPVVFHIVKSYYEMYSLLKKNFPKVRGILHSFSGSKEIFEIFKQFDLAFALGGKISSSKKNYDLIQRILKWGFFSFETDAPFQKPDYIDSEINDLENMSSIIDRIAEISAIDRGELKRKQYRTVKNIFEIKEVR